MKMPLTIIYFFITLFTASSQITVPADSTIWTFIAEYDNRPGTGYIGETVKKFKVISSNYKFPIASFFIVNIEGLPKNPFGIKTFKVQGRVLSKKDCVNQGISFNACREETRTYVTPVYFLPSLTKDLDNQK